MRVVDQLTGRHEGLAAPRADDQINTPDQRVRVFVSSTLLELAAQRQAAREAITSLGLVPVMFELGARPHPPRDLYRAYLERSDVFVAIYAHQYGWTAPGMQVSGLEDEYLLSGDRPKLIYVLDEPDRDPKLDAMLNRIRADDRASYKPFTRATDLTALLAADLATLLSERFLQPSTAGTLRRAARGILHTTITLNRAAILRILGLALLVLAILSTLADSLTATLVASAAFSGVTYFLGRSVRIPARPLQRHHPRDQAPVMTTTELPAISSGPGADVQVTPDATLVIRTHGGTLALSRDDAVKLGTAILLAAGRASTPNDGLEGPAVPAIAD